MKKNISYFGLILVFPIVFFSPLEAQEIRIGLFQKELPHRVSINANTDYAVFDGSTGRMIIERPKGKALYFERVDSCVRITGISKEKIEVDWVKLKLDKAKKDAYFLITTGIIKNRKYSGDLEIHSRPNELLVVNRIDEYTYIYSVLVNEMPISWSMEALKAQTVLIRTFTRRNLNRHKKDGYDFCDLTHCQVYKGVPTHNSKLLDIIQQTTQEVLTYKGEIAEVFYHSTCGGMTANNNDIWIMGAPRPYLRSQRDQDRGQVFCKKSPHYSWSFEIKKEKLREVLNKVFSDGESLGNFLDLDIYEKTSSGRVKYLLCNFSNGEKQISGYKFYLVLGKWLGWHLLKSTMFSIEETNGLYRFNGRGLGHGVGMCQWGAKGMAEQGYTYREILSHYFPQTKIEKLRE